MPLPDPVMYNECIDVVTYYVHESYKRTGHLPSLDQINGLKCAHRPFVDARTFRLALGSVCATIINTFPTAVFVTRAVVESECPRFFDVVLPRLRLTCTEAPRAFRPMKRIKEEECVYLRE